VSDDIVVTAADLRQARERFGGLCVSGTSRWFTRHGLSFRHFMQHGYPESKVAIDDFGKRVALIARERLSK
jgi:hypothetical protein